MDPGSLTGGRGVVVLLQVLSLPLLGLLAWIDYRQQRVPNEVILPSIAAVLGIVLVGGDGWFVAEHLGCALLLGLAFLMMALQGGGVGDAKLVALLGLVWGHLALWIVALGGILAVVVTVILAVMGQRPISRRMTFPFVPYLFLGTVVVLLTELAK